MANAAPRAAGENAVCTKVRRGTGINPAERPAKRSQRICRGLHWKPPPTTAGSHEKLKKPSAGKRKENRKTDRSERNKPAFHFPSGKSAADGEPGCKCEGEHDPGEQRFKQGGYPGVRQFRPARRLPEHAEKQKFDKGKQQKKQHRSEVRNSHGFRGTQLPDSVRQRKYFEPLFPFFSSGIHRGRINPVGQHKPEKRDGAEQNSGSQRRRTLPGGGARHGPEYPTVTEKYRGNAANPRQKSGAHGIPHRARKLLLRKCFMKDSAVCRKQDRRRHSCKKYTAEDQVPASPVKCQCGKDHGRKFHVFSEDDGPPFRDSVRKRGSARGEDQKRKQETCKQNQQPSRFGKIQGQEYHRHHGGIAEHPGKQGPEQGESSVLICQVGKITGAHEGQFLGIFNFCPTRRTSLVIPFAFFSSGMLTPVALETAERVAPGCTT